jgi:hypothetical protein
MRHAVRNRFDMLLLALLCLIALDSPGGCNYSGCMRLSRLLRVFAIPLLVATAHATPAADPPVLALLEYESGLLGSREKIRDQPGPVESPYARKPRAVWVLREGDTLKQPHPPAERLIRFYQATKNDVLTVCTIVVKYQRTSGGWRPAYHLLQQPLVIIEDGKLKPLTTEESARGLLQLVDPGKPAGDGCYHTLGFRWAAGPLVIDAWEVQ